MPTSADPDCLRDPLGNAVRLWNRPGEVHCAGTGEPTEYPDRKRGEPMSATRSRGGLHLLFVLGALSGLAPAAAGQTLVEHSAETRFQLDLHVPDAALMSFIPTGWKLNVATQGAAKDANLRAIFIDRVTINGPD